MTDIEKIISETERMHPYKVPGNRDSYGEYNQGWSDACDLLGEKIKKHIEDNYLKRYVVGRDNKKDPIEADPNHPSKFA